MVRLRLKDKSQQYLVESVTPSGGEVTPRANLRFRGQVTTADIGVLLQEASRARSAGHAQDAESLYYEILRLMPQNVSALVGLAEMCWLNGDAKSAAIHYEAAAAVDPNNLAIHEALRNVLIAQRNFDWKADIGKALQILRHERASPDDRIGACRLLIQYGVTQGLEKELALLCTHSSVAAQLLRAVKQLERTGLARSLPAIGQDGALEDDQLLLSYGITEIPVPHAETLVVVFGGANHRLDFSFDVIQRILRSTGVSTLYLRDLERQWYVNGIVGLGTSFGEAVGGLRDTVRRFGAKRILMIGNCVGCSGALRYGLAIGADAVLGIAPRIRLPRSEPQRPNLQEGLSRPQHGLPKCSEDVREQYQSAAQTPRVSFIFGERATKDAADAMYMADLKGVTLIGIADYAGHACLNLILGHGLLTRLLRDFVGDGSIAPKLQDEIRRCALDASAGTQLSNTST